MKRPDVDVLDNKIEWVTERIGVVRRPMATIDYVTLYLWEGDYLRSLNDDATSRFILAAIQDLKREIKAPAHENSP